MRCCLEVEGFAVASSHQEAVLMSYVGQQLSILAWWEDLLSRPERILMHHPKHL